MQALSTLPPESRARQTAAAAPPGRQRWRTLAQLAERNADAAVRAPGQCRARSRRPRYRQQRVALGWRTERGRSRSRASPCSTPTRGGHANSRERPESFSPRPGIARRVTREIIAIACAGLARCFCRLETRRQRANWLTAADRDWAAPARRRVSQWHHQESRNRCNRTRESAALCLQATLARRTAAELAFGAAAVRRCSRRTSMQRRTTDERRKRVRYRTRRGMLAAAGLSPLLARIYAARGVDDAADLDTNSPDLPRLVGAQGYRRRGDTTRRWRRARAAHAHRRRLRRRRRDGVRGRRARAARDGRPKVDFLVPNRFEFGYGLTPEIVALAASQDAGTDHHGRQRHRQRRRRRRRARARHRRADHRSSPARRRAACNGVDRQSEPAGLHFSEQASGRRRRDVLCAHGIARAAARARTFHDATRAQSRDRCSTSSRWARSRTSSGSITPTAFSSTRTAAHPRRPHAAGRPCIVRSRSPRSRPRHDLRPRLCRRATAQCRRSHGRHVDRHRLPARRRRRDAPIASRVELDRLNRERREVEATMQEEALATIDSIAGRRRVHDLRLSRRLAPGRGRHRRVAAQGSLPPARDRVRARQQTVSYAAPDARSAGFTCAMRSIWSPSDAPAPSPDSVDMHTRRD